MKSNNCKHLKVKRHCTERCHFDRDGSKVTSPMTTSIPKSMLQGMVGSDMLRQLLAQGHTEERIISRTHDEMLAADLAFAK